MTACELQRPRQPTSRISKQERARELAQIGAGLAHEIRNPLHALRINLHTLRRSFVDRSPLSHDQLLATIQESNASVDRVDELMRDFLQFVDSSAGEPVVVDLVDEVQQALNQISVELRGQQITVHAALSRDRASISIDPVRLRQALRNTLTFARHRAGRGGSIEVEVEQLDGGVQVSIGDSGPTLGEEQRIHLFEPFQAPAETGSALGLALVQTYVEEAGGHVGWVNGQVTGGKATGGTCRLWFPLAPRESKGERS